VGKANRQRRQIKEKARRRAATDRGGTSFFRGPQAGPPLDDLVGYEIGTALHALHSGDERQFAAAAARLADSTGRAGWHRVVERQLAGRLEATVGHLWQHGWQPADLLRATGRSLTGRHVRLLGDAIAAELRGYPAPTVDPRWRGQLAEFDITVWWMSDWTFIGAWAAEHGVDWPDLAVLALELLDELGRLPKLELLGPVPGTYQAPPAGSRADGAAGTANGSGAAGTANGNGTAGTANGTTGAAAPVDERILSRVRALLAKAESTTFEAEAETFTAGAQALMARYSIDRALLAASGRTASEEPVPRRIGVDNPYESSKVLLLDQVARANRSRAIWTKAFGYVTVLGYPADLDAVELLFTSLLVQATSAMTQQGSRTDRYGRSRTRSFRQSFLSAFAIRIGERLNEATRQETTKAAAEPGHGNLLPVLAGRDQVVERALQTMFPEMTQRVVSRTSDREGWHSGRAAADLATLATGAALEPRG
jgi:hypothetical protein